MVDPKKDCMVAPSRHSLHRMFKRGLPEDDLEQMVREADWRAEGGGNFDAVYRRWHLKVKVVPCHIIVKTVFQE